MYFLELELNLIKKATVSKGTTGLEILPDGPLDDVLGALRRKFDVQEAAYKQRVEELETRIEELEIDLEAREEVDKSASLVNATAPSFGSRGVSLMGFGSGGNGDAASELQRLAETRREAEEAKREASTRVCQLEDDAKEKEKAYKSHLEALSKQLAETELARDHAMDERRALERKLVTTEANLDALRRRNDELEAEAERRDSEDTSSILQMLQVANEELSQAKVTAEASSVAEAKARAECELYTSKYKQVLEEKHALVSKIRMLEASSGVDKSISTAYQAALEKVASLTRTNEELRAEVDELRTELDDKTSAFEALQKEAALAERAMNDARWSLDEANRDVARAHERANEATVMCSAAQTKQAEAEADLQVLANKMRGLMMENKTLRTQKATAEARLRRYAGRSAAAAATSAANVNTSTKNAVNGEEGEGEGEGDEQEEEEDDDLLVNTLPSALTSNSWG